MHVGIDREEEMEPTGGDIFPKRFHMELTYEEHLLMEAAKSIAWDNQIHFDTATAMLVINTIRELKDSNKLRGDQSGTNI